MSQPNHETARRFRQTEQPTQREERRNLAAGESQEFTPPHIEPDLLYLTPQDLEERGMAGCVAAGVADRVWPVGHPLAGQYVYPGDKVYTSVTPPGMADKAMSAHLNAKRRHRPSFQICRYPDDYHDASLRGQNISSLDDQVYATYDREEYLSKGPSSKKVVTEEAHRAFDGIASRRIENANAQDGVVQNFDGDDASLRRHRNNAHSFMQGISKDRWPKEMSLDEIRDKIGADKVLATERKFARGGRVPRPGEYEDWDKAQAEKAAASKGKGRSVSYPGSPTR